MDTKNTRTETVGRDGDDLAFYLKSGLPTAQIVSILKAQKKDQREIDAFVSKYETSKRRVTKFLRKFVDKIEQKYGQLDVPELMKKGLKFAAKHNFSDAEKEAFIRFVMKGDVDSQVLPYQELAYTEMSKFLGFSSYAGQMLDIKPTDQPTLQEIVRLFDASRLLHSDIKQQVSTYIDCAPEAMQGGYDKTKHNVNSFIHPVIVALFLIKCPAIDRRMLYTNIGRMVIQRSQPYVKKTLGLVENYLQGEIEEDFVLAYEIARDPNSLAFFSNDSPLSNLLKRFQIQIELWRNVLNLRQGRYYASADSLADNGITSLVRVLNSYDWTFFDSPDMYQAQDEGTILRKILSVFSLRPTLVQLSSFSGSTHYANVGVARATFLHTPMINIKLPPRIGVTVGPSSVALRQSLSQSDWFIENKMFVPKTKQVVHSRDIVIFYVSRRYQSVNLVDMNMSFRYLALPMSYSNLTGVNTTQVIFEDEMPLGNDFFKLRSVVCVSRPSETTHIAIGCNAIVVKQCDGVDRYFRYNPHTANLMVEDAGKWNALPPIGEIEESVDDEVEPDQEKRVTRAVGFREAAQSLGTIYLYTKF